MSDQQRRNMWAVWPGLFVVSMGIMTVLPFLPLYMAGAFGLDDPQVAQWWASLAFGAAPFAAAVMGPFWGVLGDRWGRRPMVVRATVAIAVVMGLMPLARTPEELCLLRALQGAFAGYVAPAMALGSAGAPPHQQGRVLGMMQLGLALGTLCGPLLGAEIAARWGYSAVFWVAAGLALVAALPIALWTREMPRDHGLAGRPTLFDDFRQSAGALLQNRVFVALAVVLLLMRAGQHMVEPSVALFIRDLGALPLLGEGAEGIDRTVAWSFGVLALAQVATTTGWGRLADRIGPLRCLSILAVGLSATMGATAMVVTIEGFFFWRCAGAVFMAGGMTLAYAAASKRVAPERAALAFAVVQSALQFGMSLGPPVGVAAAAVLGGGGLSRGSLYWFGCGTLAVAAAGMITLRRAATRTGDSAEGPGRGPSAGTP